MDNNRIRTVCLKDKASNKKLSDSKKAQELATKFVDKVIEDLIKLAESDEASSARWLMVHLNRPCNSVCAYLAIREYVLIETLNDVRTNVYSSNYISEDLLKDYSENFRTLYSDLVFAQLQQYLIEQDFANTGDVLPVSNSCVLPSDQSYSWFALEF